MRDLGGEVGDIRMRLVGYSAGNCTAARTAKLRATECGSSGPRYPKLVDVEALETEELVMSSATVMALETTEMIKVDKVRFFEILKDWQWQRMQGHRYVECGLWWYVL